MEDHEKSSLETFFDPGNPAAGRSCASSLYFDDLPLEEILYGESQRDPTEAGLYCKNQHLVDNLIKAAGKNDYVGAIQAALQIEQQSFALSVPMCMKIARALGALIPVHPVPIIQADISSLTRMLERICQIALDRHNRDLQETTIQVLYRCYEVNGRFSESRELLKRLWEIQIEKGNLEEEASAINNYAFAFWLEKRFKEALPLFHEATEKFQKAGAYYRVPNAKANYWDCYLRVADEIDFKEAEAISLRLIKNLRRSNFWQHRKPYLLLSRIRDRQGKIDSAIRFARKACKMSQEKPGRLAEFDREWLNSLLDSQRRQMVPSSKEA